MTMLFSDRFVSITAFLYNGSIFKGRQDAEVLHSGISGDISKENMPYLYLFIEKYKNSDLKKLSRFASGLEKDLSAVENAVASPLSNGFLSGYHMNKQHWITILLDGTVGESKILDFLNMSYDLIDGLRK